MAEGVKQLEAGRTAPDVARALDVAKVGYLRHGSDHRVFEHFPGNPILAADKSGTDLIRSNLLLLDSFLISHLGRYLDPGSGVLICYATILNLEAQYFVVRPSVK
jgi:hypothetical protein